MIKLSPDLLVKYSESIQIPNQEIIKILEIEAKLAYLNYLKTSYEFIHQLHKKGIIPKELYDSWLELMSISKIEWKPSTPKEFV